MHHFLSIFAPNLDCALREGISNLLEEELHYFLLWFFTIRGGNASGMAGGSAPQKGPNAPGVLLRSTIPGMLEVAVCTQATQPLRHYNERTCPSLGLSERGEGPRISSCVSSAVHSPNRQSLGSCSRSDTEVCSEDKKINKKQFLPSGFHTFESSLQMLRWTLSPHIPPLAHTSVLVYIAFSAQKLMWHRCQGLPTILHTA